MRNLKFFLLAFFSFYQGGVVGETQAYGACSVKTAWGESMVEEPLLQELLESPSLQRLKGIDQSGPLFYFGLMPSFSRYEHSVGVLVLLKKAQASLAEQAAGLLHDVSHTVFSHVGDYLFYKDNGKKSYQDLIHLKFLEAMKVEPLVEKYGISLKELDPDRPEYLALEQHLPDLCADRLQYLLHTGVILGHFSLEEAKLLVDQVSFKEGKWFFTHLPFAEKLALLSLHFTEFLYGSPWNCFFYHHFSELLKRGVALGLISWEDIHFKTDQEVLTALQKSPDPQIKERLDQCYCIQDLFRVVVFGEGDLNFKPKFRGIDPYVLHQGQLSRLSSLSPSFQEKFETTKAWCQKGYGIQLLASRVYR